MKKSVGFSYYYERSERHEWKGSSRELENMHGWLAPEVSSPTLGSLDMCERLSQATKWHARMFCESLELRVLGNDLEKSWSIGHLD